MKLNTTIYLVVLVAKEIKNFCLGVFLKRKIIPRY